MEHQHTIRRIVANRPGLVTLQCFCGKKWLQDYRDGKELEDLKEVIKKNANTNRSIRQAFAR